MTWYSQEPCSLQYFTFWQLLSAANTWDSKHFFPVHFSFTINSHTKWRGFKPNKYSIFEYLAFKSTDLSAFYCLVDTPWFSSSLLSMINCVSLVKDDDEDVVVVIVRLPRQCSLTWVMSSSHTSLTSPMISSIIEYTWYYNWRQSIHYSFLSCFYGKLFSRVVLSVRTWNTKVCLSYSANGEKCNGNSNGNVNADDG